MKRKNWIVGIMICLVGFGFPLVGQAADGGSMTSEVGLVYTPGPKLIDKVKPGSLLPTTLGKLRLPQTGEEVALLAVFIGLLLVLGYFAVKGYQKRRVVHETKKE